MKSLSMLAVLLLLVATGLAEAPATFPVGAFTFSRPADWEWVEVQNKMMRKAQLRMPGGEGSGAADVTFFYFGGNGGGGDVQSNITRWLGQFQSKPETEKIESKQVGSTKLTIVATEGVFSSGMPGQATTPMNDYALRGAILENAEGNVFVKMTGPAALVKAKSEQFAQFVTGAAQSLK